MIRSCFITVVFLGATAAIAGEPVQWLDSAEASATKAKESGLPILFLLVPRPGDADTAGAEPKSLTDGRVAAMLNDRWIPVQLRASTTTAILLEQMDVPDAPLYSAVAASPEGKAIGIISVAHVAAPDRFVEQLDSLYTGYCANVLKTRILPVLRKEDASATVLSAALRQVRALGIAAADAAVIELLDRKDLGDNIRDQVYRTLARLGTSRSVTTLLGASPADESAAAHLRECPPAAAEAILAAVEPDEGRPFVTARSEGDQPAAAQTADDRRFLAACAAVCAICQIPDCKPAEFWTSADPEAQQAEFNRLRQAAKKAAEKKEQPNPQKPLSNPTK